VVEKPVGFKYIGKEMLNEDIIIGGEESGGLSIKGHIPEKDGLLAGLLLLEVQSFLKNKKNNYYLSDYMDEIYREYGTFHNTRLDIHIPMEKKDKIIDHFLRLDSKDINGKKVVDVSQLDGTRLLIEDGSWILVRPSGTESLIRCYIESTNGQYFKGLNIYVNQIINKLIK
jgi:phosphomannomutase